MHVTFGARSWSVALARACVLGVRIWVTVLCCVCVFFFLFYSLVCCTRRYFMPCSPGLYINRIFFAAFVARAVLCFLCVCVVRERSVSVVLCKYGLYLLCRRTQHNAHAAEGFAGVHVVCVCVVFL